MNNIEMLKKINKSEADIIELNEQLDTKATYFENVNAIKTSNKIKVNTICKTLGYYTANDGGGAIYRITNNTALENAFSFSVSNGLTAEFLYTDEINIKQLGARDYDEYGNKVDMKPYVDLYISKTNPIGNSTINTKIIKLFIPSGRWFSSPLKLKASSLYIHGVNTYSYPYATGTVIMPLKDEQEYIWCVGDNTTESLGLEYGNIRIENIMFSTHNASQSDSIYVGALTYDKCYTCNNLLIVSRVFGSIFDNIHFTNYIGTPFSLMSSSENIFNDFSFRNGDAFETGNVVFGRDITGSKNISASFFDKFSFEGVKGHLFVFRTDSKFINNKIGTVIFEDREVNVSKDGEFTTYTVSEHGSMDFQSKAVFAINENSYCDLIVDDVLLNNFGRVIFTKDNLNYLFDTIVLEYGKIAKGQANIKNVSHIGARRDTFLLKKADYEGLGSFNWKFTCENAKHVDSGTFKFIYKTSGSIRPSIRYKKSGYERCIDYVVSPNVVFNKNEKSGYYMPVISDINSLNDEKLVIKNLNYKIYTTSSTPNSTCFKIPVLGNKLNIRVKMNTSFTIFLTPSDGSATTNYKINSTSNDYAWYQVDLTNFRNLNVGKEIIASINTPTDSADNFVLLDVFYWE